MRDECGRVGPWFRDGAGLDRVSVANHLFATAAAFLVGILSSGAIANRFVRRGVSELAVMTGFLVLFLIAQIGIVLEMTAFGLVFWLILGMSGQWGSQTSREFPMNQDRKISFVARDRICNVQHLMHAAARRGVVNSAN